MMPNEFTNFQEGLAPPGNKYEKNRNYSNLPGPKNGE